MVMTALLRSNTLISSASPPESTSETVSASPMDYHYHCQSGSHPNRIITHHIIASSSSKMILDCGLVHGCAKEEEEEEE